MPQLDKTDLASKTHLVEAQNAKTWINDAVFNFNELN